MKMKRKLNHVLLIDDDKVTNFVNKRLIDKVNVVKHVDIVLNGLEAIVHIENAMQEQVGMPELIFLDVNMPGMNGWEFIESYAPQLEKVKDDVVIVLLTTSVNPDDKKKAEGLDLVSRYVSKPLTEPVLMEIIGEHFWVGEEALV